MGEIWPISYLIVLNGRKQVCIAKECTQCEIHDVDAAYAAARAGLGVVEITPEMVPDSD